ncbi:hypothetical protein BH10ACI1_BH10ACI1_15880 [soil metagenome]
MKRCQKCGQSYEDDSLNYCLADGATLSFEGEEQTVIVPKTPPRKKGKALLWAGLVGLVVLLAVGLTAGYLIYKYFQPAENIRIYGANNTNTSTSPTAMTTPRIGRTPSPSVEQSSPKTEETKPSPTDETTDEVTPIAWTTSPTSFTGETGQTYKFECPPDGTASTIWGSDVYTADSSICTAAVHAGIITLEKGGIVTIEFRPGRQIYGSTVRNGITSNTYGEFPRSFVVR